MKENILNYKTLRPLNQKETKQAKKMRHEVYKTRHKGDIFSAASHLFCPTFKLECGIVARARYPARTRWARVKSSTCYDKSQ